MRVRLLSKLNEPTPVWVQWQVPNADGDIAECGRSLTLTPNQPALTWVYAPLPPEVEPTFSMRVRTENVQEDNSRAKKRLKGARPW